MDEGKLFVLDDGEVRVLASNGKRGFIWAKTILLKCSCGKERIVSKRKLYQYKTDLCLHCVNKLKKHEYDSVMNSRIIAGKFDNVVCKQIDGRYVNVG